MSQRKTSGRAFAQPSFLTAHGPGSLDRVALPVGGIGTGTLSVGGRGDLRDWEIVNHTSKGFRPGKAFFAVAAGEPGREKDARLLEGGLPDVSYEGEAGSPASLAGMPRFGKAACRTVYPFIEVALSDPACPVAATLLAYNPFIPSDADASGWPVAVFEITLENRHKDALEASVLFAVENFVGTDGIDTLPAMKRNSVLEDGRLMAVKMTAAGLPKRSELAGDLCIASEKQGATTSAAGLDAADWNNDLCHLWDYFRTTGDAPPPRTKKLNPTGIVCSRRSLKGFGKETFRFFLAWRFPNRLSWLSLCGGEREWIGNHYSRLGGTSWDILKKFDASCEALRRRTIEFSDAVSRSDIPRTIKEAALANLPALRSQTLFRTPDGNYFGYEGGHRNKAAPGTHGSCTHVWGYDLATSFLFPRIADSFREISLGPSLAEDGLISFRTELPLKRGRRWEKGAADGQLGVIIGFYRDWLLSGDLARLRRWWPKLKLALGFCWREGSWDADRDGVMEGCQHNTMDVEYYGPNPQIQSLYVTALRCGSLLAERLGDGEFQTLCSTLAAKGSRFLDEHLFNGEYYIQKIPASIAGVKTDSRLIAWASRSTNLEYQLGDGVLIDQMLGGLHARVCGLPEPAQNVLKALRSVVKHNHRQRIGVVSNHMRAFALADEPATLMATWPRGGKPEVPFPYYTEVMTGFEHVLAAHLLYHGEERLGLKVLAATRSRYTGRRRNPFNEAEWGNHYARALASWASLWAWTGQQYSADRGELSFRDPEKKAAWFWALGQAGARSKSPR